MSEPIQVQRYTMSLDYDDSIFGQVTDGGDWYRVSDIAPLLKELEERRARDTANQEPFNEARVRQEFEAYHIGPVTKDRGGSKFITEAIRHEWRGYLQRAKQDAKVKI